MSAAIGLGVVFVLIFFGVPIGFAMLIVGFVGFVLLVDLEPAKFMISQIAFDTSVTYHYAVLPLFILMGNFVARSKLADDLFSAAFAFVGHRRGGLAQSTILACGGFSAVCGSSVATAATMVRVALPAMRKRGYNDRLASGAVAIGGTLGILIPPSGIMLLYGLMTQTDVASLFAAGIVPGVISILLYSATIMAIVRFDPTQGPAGEKSSWATRFVAMKRVWGVAFLFVFIMGGIFLGAFTPTEGGGIGAAGALLFALSRRALTWSIFVDVMVETGRTSAMLFLILFGALVFANFVEVTGLPGQLGTLIAHLELSPIGTMLTIIAIYIALGCVLESLSMMFLTVPLFFPIIVAQGFDPVWFGIILVLVVELGLITPPIGLNIFIIQGMVPDITLSEIIAGVTPFLASLLILILLVLFVPDVALFLPRMLFSPV